MHGSAKSQVKTLFRLSGINKIGQSKHEAKRVARSAGKNTWHTIGKELGIHSYKTADAYKDVWTQCVQHAKDNFKLHDLPKLKNEHVQKFLESKINQKIAYATFQQYAAAVEKLEVALKLYAKKYNRPFEYNFSEIIKEARKTAQKELNRKQTRRAYKSPEKIISNIKNSKHRLVAEMQLSSGARISECNNITEEKLKGLQKDQITGEIKGAIHVQGKGGFRGDKYLNPETYKKIEKIVKENGIFSFNQNKYRQNLKEASLKAGQKYQGSHGLRWNFAQRKFLEVQKHGKTYEQALSITSKALFHHRADITEHYLKG